MWVHRLAPLVAVAVVASGCLFRPSNWDHQPARCTLVNVEIKSSYAGDTVWAEATYRLDGRGGERTVRAGVLHTFPTGTPRSVSEPKIVGYFERHRDLPCTWGRLTSGTCAPEESRLSLPGCREQKSTTCYQLTDEELAK